MYTIPDLRVAVLENHEKLGTIGLRAGAEVNFKLEGLAQSSDIANKEMMEELQARGVKLTSSLGNPEAMDVSQLMAMGDLENSTENTVEQQDEEETEDTTMALFMTLPHDLESRQG